MNILLLKEFFMFFFLLNLIVYVYSSFMIIFFSKWLVPIEKKLLGIKEPEVKRLNANYLALHKVLILVFALIPWLSLIFITNMR